MTNHPIKIKLVSLDIDGTLLNESGTITKANQESILKAQEKGVAVILNTGRSFLTSRDIANSLQLSSYIVTTNGGEIWDTSGNLIEQHVLNPDQIQMMWELAQKYRIYFWAISADKVWREQMITDISDHQWLKFGFDTEDSALRTKILDILKKYNKFEISNSSPTNIEVNAKGVSKAAGLRKVCKLLGIKLDEVLAIGDSLNDISMIKVAGLGIAMGNAQSIVKEVADRITATNMEDGVAKAIYQWVL